MNFRHCLIYSACFIWLFLAFSNTFIGKSSAGSLALNQTPPPLPTPIQTMTVRTPVQYPTVPKLTITPNQPVIAPQRASDGSNQRNDNKQTVTPKPIDSPTPTPTPIQTPTPINPSTPKATPIASPTDSSKSSDGSWLPWIIAGVLFVIVVFLLGRNSKD
jgi:hypothetical protein